MVSAPPDGSGGGRSRRPYHRHDLTLGIEDPPCGARDVVGRDPGQRRGVGPVGVELAPVGRVARQRGGDGGPAAEADGARAAEPAGGAGGLRRAIR